MKTTDVVAKMVELLSSLSSEDRQRVIQATLMLLGDTAFSPTPKAQDSADAHEDREEPTKFPPRAKSWMKQNDIPFDALEEVFHFGDEGIEIIVSQVPGKQKPEQVQNAYVLRGIANLLMEGSANFTDDSARELCKHVGCYDNTNHSRYVKGNKFTGSKAKGWSLTGPGLKHGAALVKELSNNDS